jgi:hypothetical protein
MVTDFDILGIGPTDDLEEVKRAFRKKVKQTHPDVTESRDGPEGQETFKRHLLFIQVNQAYQRLAGTLKGAGKGSSARGGNSPPTGRGAPSSNGTPRATGAATAANAREPGRGTGPRPEPATGGAIALHADPAYVLYKNAMKLFMKVHPSQWTADIDKIAETYIPGHEAANAEIQAQVRELVTLFPKAYYYFSLVFHEYPESVWAPDAQDKMRLIERRTMQYKRIIESFVKYERPLPRIKKVLD